MTSAPFRVGQQVVSCSRFEAIPMGHHFTISNSQPSWLAPGSFDYQVKGGDGSFYGHGCFLPYELLPQNELDALLTESFLL